MDYRIRQLINSLPLADKVGQLFMLAIAGPDLGWARTLIAQLQIGGFYLTDDNARTPLQHWHLISSCSTWRRCAVLTPLYCWRSIRKAPGAF